MSTSDVDSFYCWTASLESILVYMPNLEEVLTHSEPGQVKQNAVICNLMMLDDLVVRNCLCVNDHTASRPLPSVHAASTQEQCSAAR